MAQTLDATDIPNADANYVAPAEGEGLPTANASAGVDVLTGTLGNRLWFSSTLAGELLAASVAQN